MNFFTVNDFYICYTRGCLGVLKHPQNLYHKHLLSQSCSAASLPDFVASRAVLAAYAPARAARWRHHVMNGIFDQMTQQAAAVLATTTRKITRCAQNTSAYSSS